MAIPKHGMVIRTPPADIPLLDVEALESGTVGSLHRFLIKHTNVTEAEFAEMTVGDSKTLMAQLLVEVQKASIPLDSDAP